MATFSTNTLQTISTLEPEATVVQCAQAGARRNRAQRLVVAGARVLHEVSFVFYAFVKAFRALQRLGISITPNHYYWPVPDTTELAEREWPIYSPPPDCNFDLKSQVELAAQLKRYGDECSFSKAPSNGSYHYSNGYFEAVDAEMAYCLVRRYKPARVIEIGTGYSTRILAAALNKNRERDGVEGRLLSVDPSPERFPQNSWRDLVTQVPVPVQRLPLEFFDVLGGGDILFVDSSHVVAVGSDVVHEYLQILPRLRPGVIVHLHDIFLPADYPRQAVLEHLSFWSEQYLLQAFLSFNSAFEVLWAASAMQIHCPWVLDECFPSWQHSYRDMPDTKRRFVPTRDGDRVWPSSFWIRRL
ncbi:MAG: class I SAM-dependent methyltransferase [Acidobacteria bacterium]|nr:class I SAM-dependent methyltransferase [Acidobacteriota bacterium]